MTYFNYGMLLLGLQKYEEAAGMLELGLKVKGDFVSAQYGLFRAYYGLDKAKAISYLE